MTFVDQESYSSEDLTERAGIPVRTLRYYVAEGLLPGPGHRGRGARYGPEHLDRLFLIRQLTAQHVPLAQIRERLARLSDTEVRQLVKPAAITPAPSPRAFLEGLLARVAPPPKAAPQPETWRRYPLKPGLEIALRSDMESRYDTLLGRILKLVAEAE